MLGIASHNIATLCAGPNRCVCAVFDTSTSTELPLQLRSYLEMVAELADTVPETMELKSLEHVSDIAQGGYGTVLLMRHVVDGRPVALKVNGAVTPSSLPFVTSPLPTPSHPTSAHLTLPSPPLTPLTLCIRSCAAGASHNQSSGYTYWQRSS